jgi:NAD(P)-dependent dehydrogenase (short-subunit alcohol dehydrogenase family)
VHKFRAVKAQTVLITGCSSGIGRATAQRLAANGWTVYATARDPESIADLEGCRRLALDVTDEASMAAAVETIEDEHGAVGVLINNAGINELGAIETVPIANVRRLFDTNVVGAVRLTQLVLPRMRAQRWGRIVNVGSMNGRFAWPGMGHYCATKHALEAISDALRHELRPFGIHVALIQAGFVKTHFGNTAAARVRAHGAGPYATYNAEIAHTAKTWQEGPNARLAASAEDVAETIEKAINKPKSRYRVAPSAAIMLTTRKLLPDAAFDAFVRTQFPSPKG